jgi:hypothetical protein
MKRFVASILTLALVAGFSTTQVFARGGGHGGGHHGGGHHGGHHGGRHHSSHHHSGHHAHHGHHSSHHYAHHGNHHPFSHGWGRHHGAWGWGDAGYGWGDPWAAAGLGAAAGWLGADALAADDYPVDNYYTSDDSPQQSDATSADTQQTADGDAEPETFQPAYSSEQAGQLAANGATEPADAKYLPLGVYTFAPVGQNDATGMFHFALSKQGVLRGSYYDLKTDKQENIQGSVDKKTGVVAFTVAPDSKVVYQTTLRDLTSQSGPVAVHDAGGKTTEWTIARAEKNPSEAKTGKPSSEAPKAEPSTQK